MSLLFLIFLGLIFRVVELVAVNKMGVPNIAMIFGPTLMSNENVSTDLLLV